MIRFSPADLYDHYQERFRVIACVDLSDLVAKHQSAFAFFKQYYRDSFEPDDRLIIYTAHRPEQKILDHLQRAASRIDISNWFLLIVCPYDITADLLASNQKYGNDQEPIRSERLEVVGTDPVSSQRIACFDTICPLPFMKIDLGPDGHIKPCCKFDSIIGQIDTESMAQAFAGDTINQVRKSMMQGQKPRECAVCWHNESAGTTSLRQHMLHHYQDHMDQQCIDSPQILAIDLMPSTLCNFACRICDAGASSKIAVEQATHSEDALHKQKLLSWIKRTTSIEQSQRMVTHVKPIETLRYLHVMGGEPLLWPGLQDLVNHYISAGQAGHMHLMLHTNGSHWSGDLMAKISDHFHSAEVLLSVDNVGRKFEIERGGHWSEVLLNLKRFSKIRSPKVVVKLSVTVNIQNLLDLEDLIDLSRNLELDGVFWHYLERPESLCIDHVTSATRDLVLHKYQHHADPELRAIATRVGRAHTTDGSDFLDHTQRLDGWRGQKFSHSHPEIYRAMAGRDADGSIV